MKKFAIVVAVALPLMAVVPAQAQKLQPGKWTGTVRTPSGEVSEVTYDVTLKGDTIGITVTAPAHGSFPFGDVKLNDKTLTFWFEPGPRVDCLLLRRDDGAFEGACNDPGGGSASMLMLPPKKE